MFFKEAPNSLSQSRYASTDERLLEMMNKLRSFGVAAKIDLPTIVFCGNQSAGKSSLLEAISEIQLPKADGTCTRCPMELRLSKKAVPWMCQIKIRWEYGKDGHRVSDVREVPFGHVIDDADSVEERVRYAQKAVLNPSTDLVEFLNPKNVDISTNELKFSKNIVCIDVCGEKCPNLSLMDLPGIIRHTEDGDEHLVRLIVESVDHYIQKSNAIIIATITCKDDVENQEIVKKSRDYDPEGIRTLGVLTKPDTIEQDCHEKFFKVLRGHSHPLKLGYYAIRNLAQAELSKTNSARKLEAEFFKTDLWRSVPQERLGVPNLTRQLSQLLIEAIRRQLPGIKQEVSQKSRMADDRLGKIRDTPLAAPRVEANKLVYKFVEHVKEAVQVKSNKMNLWNDIQPHFLRFCNDIRRTRPRFKDEKTNKEYDFYSTPVQNVTAQKPPYNNVTYQNFFQNMESEILEDDEIVNFITREEVEKTVEKYQGRQLRGVMPYQALCDVLERCQKTWRQPAITCLNNIAEVFIAYLESEIKVIFSAYPPLAREITGIVSRLHSTLVVEAKHILEDIIIPMECSLPPYTWNTHYLLTNRDKFQKNMDMQSINADGITDVMIIISAYFKVACKRFSDNVPLAIDLVFLHKFNNALHEQLMKDLGLAGGKEDVDVDVESLMEEDRNITNEREDLLAQRECYSKALEELSKF